MLVLMVTLLHLQGLQLLRSLHTLKAQVLQLSLDVENLSSELRIWLVTTIHAHHMLVKRIE